LKTPKFYILLSPTQGHVLATQRVWSGRKVVLKQLIEHTIKSSDTFRG